jgi:glutathione S-transferase
MSQPPPATPPVTMLTFGPMIDSETVRRLLDLYQVPFTEERHLFLWGSIVALFRAGTVVIPVVMGPGLSLSGSRAVANHFDPLSTADRQLIPGDPALRQQVEADWTAFHNVLATAVARIAYYHLLPQVKPMIACFSAGVAPAEAAQTARWYGLLRWVFTTLLQLNAANIASGLDQVRRAMDDLEKRVADGRDYLVGDRPTLSDVALAGAMWPLIMPEGCTAPVPSFADTPPALQAIVTEMRARPSGRFINHLYRRLRSPPAQP